MSVTALAGAGEPMRTSAEGHLSPPAGIGGVPTVPTPEEPGVPHVPPTAGPDSHAAPDATTPAALPLPPAHEPDADGRVSVIVELAAPGMRLQSLDGLGVASIQADFLSDTRVEVDLVRQYRATPMLAVSVDADDLEALEDDPRVARVFPNLPMQFFVEEGQMMVNQPSALALGYTGAGKTIAIVDSGVQVSHPAFTGKTIPEFCFDLGTNQLDLVNGGCPNGQIEQSGPGAAADSLHHGTTVAAIAAASGGGGVAPGMAPEAEIVAYRIGGPRGAGVQQIWTADILAALDHILEERDDVDVVNLSLGTFTTYSSAATCDAINGPYTTFVNDLRARGTLVVAASGNSASTSGLSLPACLSTVVSVGAVYDAPGGGFAYDKCTDASRARDQVTCYSNTAPILDLLAPSHCVTSATTGGQITGCFGGTSAAAPYVAGAVALLMESGLDADQALAALVDTGVPITDTRNGVNITKPRIDLADAFGVDITITVGDKPIYDTVQKAVDVVPFGGTVQLPAATYTENITVLTGKQLTLVGLGGAPTDTVLAGVADAGNPTIDVPAGADLTLRNLRVTGGEDSGIINAGNLDLEDVIVSGNATFTPHPMPSGPSGGGGILNTTTGVLDITDSVITGNTATGDPDPDAIAVGGGIANYGTLAIMASDIAGNSVDDYGGGIYNHFGATLVVSGASMIAGNTANRTGGGIRNRGQITITSTTITSNNAVHAEGEGGGLAGAAQAGFPALASQTLTGVTVSGNLAARGAGLATRGTTTVTNSIIASNTTTGGTLGDGLGGGIFHAGPGVLTIAGGTIGGDGAGNSARFGGGVGHEGGTIIVRDNAIIRANQAGYGGGIASWGGTLTVEDGVDIRGNNAAEVGGGVFVTYGLYEGSVSSTGSAAIHDSTLRNNQAASGGGAAVTRGTLLIADSTVQADTTTGDPGAAVHNHGGNLTVQDSTFTTNASANPGDGGDIASIDFAANGGVPARAATTIVRRTHFAAFDDAVHAYTVHSAGSDGGTATNALDARFNWWSDATGPVAGATSGNVDVSPYCTDPGCTPAPLKVEVAGTGTISLGGTAFNCVEGVCTPPTAIGAGSSVTLTPVPGGGMNFSAWGGECSTGGVIMIPLLDDAAEVVCTATFVVAPPPPVGGGGGGGGGGAAPPPQPTPTPTPPVRDSTGVVVEVVERITAPASTTATRTLETGTNGTTARLTVPAAAIPGATEVSLGAIPDLAALLLQAPARGVTGLILAYHVEALESAGNTITANFRQPVELEFTVPLSSLPANITILELTVAFWNGTSWVEIPATVVRNANGTATLTASVNHFTIFSVAYRPGLRFFAQPLRAQAVTFSVWGGGTIAEATRSDIGRVASLWILRDGRFRGYAVGSPDFANQSFRSLFPGDYIPANTPIIVVTQ